MKKNLARVLAVEDDQDIGFLIQAALAHFQIEATLITTGEEALTRLATETYDLIMLDIALPGISGLEVCRQLKADERLKRIPVLFISGQTSKPYHEEAKLLGAVDFIEKPFTLAQLISCVTGHLKLRISDEEKLHKLGPLPVP